MATKRLIDADLLCDLLDVEYKRKKELIQKGEDHLDTLAEGLFSADIVIATMPKVDAVEVVRCKDCIHWEKGDSKGGNSIEDLQWLGGCKWAKCCCREMDFCSMGERKVNE
jgi:hypothetical protein